MIVDTGPAGVEWLKQMGEAAGSDAFGQLESGPSRPNRVKYVGRPGIHRREGDLPLRGGHH